MPKPTETQVRPPADRTRARMVLPFAVIGLLLALTLFGAGLFMLLGGGSGTAIGGPFTLVNGNGQTVTDRSFRGKYMLVYFGYTYCPDVCPTTLNEMTGALDKLGAKAKRIQPLFITVDPARDTPAAIKQYAAAFSPRLMGLTGTVAEIDKAEREYRVYAAKHVTGPGPNDYSMDHSSFFYLMGPEGQFIAPIEAGDTADELARKLDHLVS
jgi:cytochrome oxidase Cu insertion factor (SCO1/SenC/PrrC family)